MSIVDQFSDPAFGVLVKTLREMPALENFVKTASMDRSEVDELPAAAFAWPEERRFPVHTPEHAALSYAYSKTAAEIPPSVTASIKHALDVYGVPESTFETVKVAHEERSDDWLCPDLKLFSVKTAAEVPVAENAFLRDYEKLNFEHRKTAAANLFKVAEVFKKPVNPLLMKVAGKTVSDIPTLRTWVEARAAAAVKAEHKSAYQKFAADLRALPQESNDGTALMKFASALAKLDELAGLEKYYDRKLPDPLLTVFNTDKVAAETLDLDGAMVPLEKLKALPVTFWEDLGGGELKDEVAPGGKLDAAKLRTVVETLPLDLKRVIKAQVR